MACWAVASARSIASGLTVSGALESKQRVVPVHSSRLRIAQTGAPGATSTLSQTRTAPPRERGATLGRRRVVIAVRAVALTPATSRAPAGRRRRELPGGAGLRAVRLRAGAAGDARRAAPHGRRDGPAGRHRP